MGDQFTRRDVNRSLLAVAVMLAAPGAVLARRPPAELFDFAIAGGWYHGLDKVRDAIGIGEALRLRAEPANPHDPNAVAVHRQDGLMLGYLPRAANEPIARLLAEGTRIEARVVGHLIFDDEDDIPEDFAFTGFTNGDPRIRLTTAG
jgi:hypothetical protein